MKIFDLVAITVCLGTIGLVLLIIFVGVSASKRDYINACLATDLGLAQCEFMYLNRS